MHFQRIGPLAFVTERIEAEDLLALLDQRSLLSVGILFSGTSLVGRATAGCCCQRDSPAERADK